MRHLPICHFFFLISDTCSLRGTFLKGMPTAEVSPTFPVPALPLITLNPLLTNSLQYYSILLIHFTGGLANPFPSVLPSFTLHRHPHSSSSHAQTISNPHASHIQPLHNPLLCCYTHAKPSHTCFHYSLHPITFKSYITFTLHQFVIYLNSFSTFP